MWIMIGCSLLCLCLCLPLFFHFKPRNLSLASLFKSLGTLCALVPALISALRLEPVSWIFVAALCFHSIADYILEFRFELGAGLFLLGHVCYIAAFLKLYPLTSGHLILLVCFLGWLAFLLYRNRARLGKSLPLYAVYGTVLSIMAACGMAGGATSYSSGGLMTLLGAALFLFSDNLLFLRLLDPGRYRFNALIMVTYDLAQLLLGCSCLL